MIDFALDPQSEKLFAKIHVFRAHITIRHETAGFLVKTAENPMELIDVLRLRHQVFLKEWQGKEQVHGLDIEDYDFRSDHLMIIDKNKGQVVGTYRLMASVFTNQFYSQSEFDLTEFLRWPIKVLEMGRACTHADYRTGQTFDLLWRGLAQYIKASQAQCLFGCSSVKTSNPAVVASLIHHLQQSGQYSDAYNIRPLESFRHPEFSLDQVCELSREELKQILPSLLRSYLQAGAKVYGEPAFDKEFACFDLLTILDMKNITKRHYQRYFELSH